MTAAELTKQGIAAHRAGDMASAADFFRQATEVDPAYEMAWLWRSSVAATDGERRSYLEAALKANPASEPAKRGLAQLGAVAETQDVASVPAPPELAAPAAPTVPLAPGVVPKKGTSAGQILLIGLGVVGLIALMLVFGGRQGGGTFQPDRVSAWVDCREFVKKGLKAPASAVFPSSAADGVTIARLADGRWSVLGYVDAQNAFGATLRQDFGCQVSYSGSTATLHVLRIGDQVLIDN